MAESARPIRLTVTFEADDNAALIEAMESFVADFTANGVPANASSMSTGGWRYKSEVNTNGG